MASVEELKLDNLQLVKKFINALYALWPSQNVSVFYTSCCYLRIFYNIYLLILTCSFSFFFDYLRFENFEIIPNQLALHFCILKFGVHL